MARSRAAVEIDPGVQDLVSVNELSPARLAIRLHRHFRPIGNHFILRGLYEEQSRFNFDGREVVLHEAWPVDELGGLWQLSFRPTGGSSETIDFDGCNNPMLIAVSQRLRPQRQLVS